MKKTLVCLVILALVFSVFVGCSSQSDAETPTSQEESAPPSSTSEKDEAELVLEHSLWQANNRSAYLLFHDGKQVSEYDLSFIDGETEEIEKCLSYSVQNDKNTGKTVYFPYLLGKYDIYFQYNSQEKSFTVKENAISLKQTDMKSFVQTFSKQIQKVDTDKQWNTQAEMNVAIGVRCKYWDTLYQAIDYYLKATLSSAEYAVFQEETKNFTTARTVAMEEAGNQEEDGSLYPVVTGGVYCTKTQQQIETILTKYFS